MDLGGHFAELKIAYTLFQHIDLHEHGACKIITSIETKTACRRPLLAKQIVVEALTASTQRT